MTGNVSDTEINDILSANSVKESVGGSTEKPQIEIKQAGLDIKVPLVVEADELNNGAFKGNENVIIDKLNTDVNLTEQSKSSKAAPAETEAAKSEEEKPADEDKKPGKGFARRISGLTKKVRDLSTKNAEKDAEIAQLKAKLGDKPVEGSYNNQVEYFEALSDHRHKQDRLSQLTAEKDEIAKSAEQLVKEAYNDKLKAYVKITPQFSKDMEGAQFSDAVATAVLQADNAPEVAHYLAVNRDKLIDINGLNTFQAAYEVGKIEAELAHKKEAAVSKASDPITPVKETVTQSQSTQLGTGFDFKAFSESDEAKKILKRGNWD